jgi:hypothetical protein
MMKFFYSVNLIFFSFVALLSCTKDNQAHPRGTSKDVYILGAQYIDFPEIPTYWKNGTPILLADTNLNPETIVVSGSDIYIGGWDRGAISVYYKNDIRYVFNNQIFQNASMGLTVSGEDVYMTGVGDSLGNVAYWKNNNPVVIEWSLGTLNGAHSSGPLVASAIAISGADVYATGQIADTILNFGSFVPIAAYWKNGNINYLGNSAVFANPTGIAVSGSDVYISANKYGDLSAIGNIVSTSDTAMYWVNGVPVRLGPGYTNSIFVFNGDVYVSGTTIDGSAVYWKNGNQIILAANANTKGIVVVDNDVYVAGNLGYRYGVYWKNGVVDTLCTNGFITAITLGN